MFGDLPAGGDGAVLSPSANVRKWNRMSRGRSPFPFRSFQKLSLIVFTREIDE